MKTDSFFSKLLILPIRFYQLCISPFLGRNCRYYPSCSEYASTAIKRFGPLKGTYLGAKRICRCTPWHQGGVDHVPETFNFFAKPHQCDKKTLK